MRRMISQSGFAIRMFATRMLFVTTGRLRWCGSARAMASVVVPMSRKTESDSGTRGAQAAAMAALPS